MSTWTFNGREFTQDMVTDDMAGFVYELYNHGTGQSYIGKKVFWSRLTLKPLKGQKRKRRVLKASDWQKYWGSSNIVKKEIENYPKSLWSRKIISIHNNRSELNYAELCELVMRNVLGAKLADGRAKYYNGNIERRYYVSKFFAKERHTDYIRRLNQANNDLG